MFGFTFLALRPFLLQLSERGETLFQLCMRAQEGASTEHRIKTLGSTLQNFVYTYVCRSLFKADRLMFALHMVHGMYPDMFKQNVSSSAFNLHSGLKN